MKRALKPLCLSVLAFGVSFAVHARRDVQADASSPRAPATQPVQVELTDGSVLQLPSEPASGKRLPLPDGVPDANAGSDASEEAAHLRMLRRGQIFDPATPGVVASVRG